MKILYVRGNPRDNGGTEIVGNLFLRGLKKGGAEILDFRLSEKNIGDCRGCFACSAGFDRCGKCLTTIWRRLSNFSIPPTLSSVYRLYIFTL